MRKTGKWKAITGKVKHITELWELLSAVTNDNRFIEMFQKSKGKVNDMSCVALDYLAEEYETQVRDSAMLDSIRNLMKTAKCTAQQAMEALLIPKEDRQRYADRL